MALKIIQARRFESILVLNKLNILGQTPSKGNAWVKRVIADSELVSNVVATAAAALLGMACDVYMGAEDANVFRMEMMGATVHAVEIRDCTSKMRLMQLGYGT